MVDDLRAAPEPLTQEELAEFVEVCGAVFLTGFTPREREVAVHVARGFKLKLAVAENLTTFTPETKARLAILRAEQEALRAELQGLLDEDAKTGAPPPTDSEWAEPKTLPNDIRQAEANVKALDEVLAKESR